MKCSGAGILPFRSQEILRNIFCVLNHSNEKHRRAELCRFVLQPKKYNIVIETYVGSMAHGPPMCGRYWKIKRTFLVTKFGAGASYTIAHKRHWWCR